jgi:hypothetical protein
VGVDIPSGVLAIYSIASTGSVQDNKMGLRAYLARRSVFHQLPRLGSLFGKPVVEVRKVNCEIHRAEKYLFHSHHDFNCV